MNPVNKRAIVLCIGLCAASTALRATEPLKPEEGVTRVAKAARSAAMRNRQKKGDELFDIVVRAAAVEARNRPEIEQLPAFLHGLAIAINDETLPPLSLRGRSDLAKHFTVSAALAQTVGAKAAEDAGIFKEHLDMHFGSGFSFSDLLANLAGIAFRERLHAGTLRLETVANAFSGAAMLPDPAGLRLEDGLTSRQFAQKYGNLRDPRFLKELERVRQSVAQREKKENP